MGRISLGRQPRSGTGCLCVVIVGLMGGAGGQQPGAAETATIPSDLGTEQGGAASPGGPWNLRSPTLGGTQFWSDELIYHDWRIQRHSWSGHCRLLDSANHRRAWGTCVQCRQKFLELKRELQLPELGPVVIVLLHGLGRTRHSMDGICDYLRQHSGRTVLNLSYASTRGGLSDHASTLAKVLQNLGEVRRISLVGHSMGNIVIRRYLHEAAAANELNPRIHRIVMLAPPNHGAQLAQRLRGQLFETVMGAGADELAQEATELESKLAIPSCEFGIIAGGTGTDAGRNPLLEGDDDFVVSVSETRLPGARDFLLVPALHSTIMDHPAVQQSTLRFLQSGSFGARIEPGQNAAPAAAGSTAP